MMSLEELPLRKMTLTGLNRKGIKVVSDLATLTETELQNINGVGFHSVAIIKAEMKRSGIAFRAGGPT